MPLAGEVVRWPITGKGMLTYSPSAKVLEESATPGLQCTFALGSFKNGQIGELEETPGSAPGPGRCSRCRAVMSRPSRTGPARRRRSTRYLSEETDRRAIIGGLRLARRDFRCTRAEAVRPRREPAGHAG